MSLDSFRSKFKGDLVLPSDADYEGALARWAVNSQKRASVVAFVKDALDISEAIKYARSQKLDIAIRGGGHHASGASSTEGGLVIDLSRYLGDVRVDPAQQLAYVGGGALLEALDKKAIEHGLATVVGIINHVCYLPLIASLAPDISISCRRALEGESITQNSIISLGL
jgi:FAD/FMN-containing dehydrogenase